MSKIIKTITLIRSPFVIILSALWTVFSATLQLLMIPFFPRRFREILISQGWSRGLLLFAGVRLKVEGVENLPSTGALFVFNHCSLYDIPIAHAAIWRPIRFGAKQELFKIPFLSAGMRGQKVIPIDRANRDKVLNSYRKIYPEVRAGDNVILAPEGTRQKEEKIGPFKTGPFIFSVECGCPMVPVVISGASQLLGKKSFWINIGHLITTVHVRILKPVDPKKYSMDSLELFMSEVKEKMEASLAELQAKRDRTK